MVTPSLRHNYRATFPKRDRGCYCYELLGFDILVDRDLKPSLIEVKNNAKIEIFPNSFMNNVLIYNLGEFFAQLQSGHSGRQCYKI